MRFICVAEEHYLHVQPSAYSTLVDINTGISTATLAIVNSLTNSSIYPAHADFVSLIYLKTCLRLHMRVLHARFHVFITQMRECGSAICHSLHMEIRQDKPFVVSIDEL